MGGGRSGWTRLGEVLVGGVLLGFGIAYAASALRLPDSMVAGAWFVGGALSLVSLVLLFSWGVADLYRRRFGSGSWTRRRAAPGPGPGVAAEAFLPGPGWRGWRMRIDGSDHEVWVSPDDEPRFTCDGEPVVPELLRSGRFGRAQRALDVAGHPARLVPRTDWGAIGKGVAILAPILLLLATLGGTGGAGGGSLPTRWRLFVDDHERPDTERVRAPSTASSTSPPKPPRTLRAQPPGS